CAAREKSQPWTGPTVLILARAGGDDADTHARPVAGGSAGQPAPGALAGAAPERATLDRGPVDAIGAAGVRPAPHRRRAVDWCAHSRRRAGRGDGAHP